MQFIANGPDIPNALLQAHEEGRVVFFCGAGISYPAGLPDFKGLVEKLYEYVGERRDSLEEVTFIAKEFDRTVGHFESRVQGGSRNVRRHLARILLPDLHRRRAVTSHIALLTLARQRGGPLRLVTTNFDLLFEIASDRGDLPSFAIHPEPPARSNWDGLVYLHGRLPSEPSEDDLDRLVLSDADFGKAYLLEAWAARFVSALFSDYVVCFVGYSIDDPVLRYMTAAHAADVSAAAMFAFAAFGEPADRERQSSAWKAKNVTPILYCDGNAHKSFHRTLQVWASLYRDGVKGRERVVSRLANRNTRASSKENDLVGRMLWALSHESGLPAMRFANSNPAPPIEWLAALDQDRYQHSDLNRFGVVPQAKVDDKLRFSLATRPAPYGLAPFMALASVGAGSSEWDDVMFQLARWLMRHLNNPTLIIWLAQRGAKLHDRWSSLIEHELDRFARLVREGQTTELDEIRARSPDAIPEPQMQVLWRMLLTGKVKSPRRESALYRWQHRMNRDGLTATVRLELRELLSPKVILKKPFSWDAQEESKAEPTRMEHLVAWELMLTADDVHSALLKSNNTKWRASLPELMDDFQQLLRDALDLLHELGDAGERSDRSHWHLPSISLHRQNRRLREWVTLIELLRDAWLATFEVDPKRARRVALVWFELPYPTFKRLALFAANRDGCVSPEEWCQWLVKDSAWWLWSVETQRETMRLLVVQAAKLEPCDRALLESAVLAGPPRDMFRFELEPAAWEALAARDVWLRLAKLREGGSQLGAAAARRFELLSAANPQWELASNESDEFSHWMTGTGDPDYDAIRDVDVAPRKRKELVAWLKKPPPERRPLYEDTWRETCRTRFFHSFLALRDLADEGIWLPERWREALQAWGEEGKVLRSWRFAAPFVQRIPDSVLLPIVHALTWWMEVVSKSIELHETLMLHLCRRVLELPLDSDTGIRQNGEPIKDPVTEAINHPIGHVTQALLNIWLRRSPKDQDSLPADIKPLITQLCDVNVDRFRHGRVMLAANLIALFRVDRSWTEAHLLPFFDWAGSATEVRAAWCGFLWSPRFYPPLLVAFKSQFLCTARHYEELGEQKGQFADILTRAALGSVDGYAPEDFQAAIAQLPQDGLERVAYVLVQALESAAEQRENYWKNRVQPFWHRVWPKSRDLASDSIAESLARLCIAAGTEFPAALAEVLHWLRPIEHPDFAVHLLYESGLCRRFPDAALRLLDAILSDQLWVPSDLRACLNLIAQAQPELRNDPRYRQLEEYLRRRGR